MPTIPDHHVPLTNAHLFPPEFGEAAGVKRVADVRIDQPLLLDTEGPVLAPDPRYAAGKHRASHIFERFTTTPSIVIRGHIQTTRPATATTQPNTNKIDRINWGCCVLAAPPCKGAEESLV